MRTPTFILTTDIVSACWSIVLRLKAVTVVYFDYLSCVEGRLINTCALKVLKEKTLIYITFALSVAPEG